MSDYEIDDDELTYDEEEIISSDDEFDNETVLSDDIVNDDIANDDIANDDIANDDIANDDIANDDIANDDIANYDIANDDIANDDIAAGDEYEVITNDKGNKKIIDSKLSKKAKHLSSTKFSDPSLINKNIVLERSNKPRTVIIVADEDRITSDHLQRAERAGLIAIRAKQIANDGAPEYLNDIVMQIKKNKINISSNDIAEAELMNRKCPLKVRREIGVNSRDELIVEEWNPNDMKIHV
jgi:hypothetical protein